MARHQVHRCRWLACRRRSAAPPITISRLSRGKTVEKCTGSRPARKSKSPERYMKPGGFRFWSRSLLLVHLVLVLPSHAVLLLCKWSSCCTSFSWCCLCVGRGCCWTCLTETGSKSEQKSQAIANKIHAPFRSLTLCCRSRCFLLLFLGVAARCFLFRAC